MEAEEIIKIVNAQKDFFKSGKTLDIKFRITQLKNLYKTIKKYQPYEIFKFIYWRNIACGKSCYIIAPY